MSFQNLSTVAIFFSGVNASTIQYSYSIERSTLSVLINLFWFISLILSAASAVDSQFAIAWISSRYRSPTRHTPRITELAITQAPIVLLGVSACAFLFGLVFFAFHAFGDHVFLSLAISSIAGIMCTILLLIALWQFGELYIGRRYSGVQQWLWPYLCGPRGPKGTIARYLQAVTIPRWVIKRRSSWLRYLSAWTSTSEASAPSNPPTRSEPEPLGTLRCCKPVSETYASTPNFVDNSEPISLESYHTELLCGDDWNDLMRQPPVMSTEFQAEISSFSQDPIHDLWLQLAPMVEFSFLERYIEHMIPSADTTRAVIALGSTLLFLEVGTAAPKYAKKFQHPRGATWYLPVHGISHNGRYFMAAERCRESKRPSLWLWDTEVTHHALA